MRQREINFKCSNCEYDIKYLLDVCYHCDIAIQWKDVELEFEDKYLEIYTVHV